MPGSQLSDQEIAYIKQWRFDEGDALAPSTIARPGASRRLAGTVCWLKVQLVGLLTARSPHLKKMIVLVIGKWYQNGDFGPPAVQGLLGGWPVPFFDWKYNLV